MIRKEGQRLGLSSLGFFPLTVATELSNDTQIPDSIASVAPQHLKELGGTQSHRLKNPQEWHLLDRRHEGQKRKNMVSGDVSWKSRVTVASHAFTIPWRWTLSSTSRPKLMALFQTHFLLVCVIPLLLIILLEHRH